LPKGGGEKMNELKPTQPEKKFRVGGVSATVWINSTEKGSFPNIQLSRSYLDKEKNWKDTNSYGMNDVPKALLVLGEAYKYIAMKEKEKTVTPAV